jgi:hypothetical protein
MLIGAGEIPLMLAQYRVASAAGALTEFVARVQPGEQVLQSPGLHPGYGLVRSALGIPISAYPGPLRWAGQNSMSSKIQAEDLLRVVR